MANCYVCGRGPQYGNTVSHSNVHTKRRWRLNVQKKTIVEGGRPKRVMICAHCLKTLNKAKA